MLIHFIIIFYIVDFASCVLLSRLVFRGGGVGLDLIILIPDHCFIGVGRFRILGGQGLEFGGGTRGGGQIPSRHMAS